MKYNFLITALVIISKVGFSQNYMDEIVLKACECSNTISDTLESERFNMELGLCMLNAATPYKKQLNKDYKIDLNKIDTQGEQLGRIIGLKMASVCPNILMKMANRVKKKEANKISESIYEGEIVNIDDNKFVEFSVKDEFGKISKFHWLTFIESNVELSNNYKTLLHKSVQIAFLTQEFFDARVAEYRTINIIQKLEIKEK
jgi:hypothetical protein